MSHVPTRPVRFTALCALLPALLLAGCGGSTEPKAQTGNVSGKVTFKGAPVVSGEVVFTHPEINTEVVAPLGPEGKYAATNVVLGDLLVSVRPTPPPPSMDPKAAKAKPPEPADIPAKFRKAKTSDLKLRVAAGENTLDIAM